jgi:hypothetical protein
VDGKANVEIDSCTLTNNRAGLPFIHSRGVVVAVAWMLDRSNAVAISAGFMACWMYCRHRRHSSSHDAGSLNLA